MILFLLFEVFALPLILHNQTRYDVPSLTQEGLKWGVGVGMCRYHIEFLDWGLKVVCRLLSPNQESYPLRLTVALFELLGSQIPSTV